MGNEAAPPSAGWIRTVAFGRNPAWTVVRIVVLVVTVFVLLKYVILLRKIESTSMLPSFREGSIHVIYRFAYGANRGPERRDIVAIRTSGETVMYVKRIIGLPGETIEFRYGKVLINETALDEPYVREKRLAWHRPPRVLGPAEYFVTGDNRSMPQEQHEFGVIEEAHIVGKVIW